MKQFFAVSKQNMKSDEKHTGILPFNKNYGILFVVGRVSVANTIVPLDRRKYFMLRRIV